VRAELTGKARRDKQLKKCSFFYVERLQWGWNGNMRVSKAATHTCVQDVVTKEPHHSCKAVQM